MVLGLADVKADEHGRVLLCCHDRSLLVRRWRVLAGREVITLGIHVTKALVSRVLPLSAIRDHRTGPG
ncbi:hypothetical protein NNL26_11720 [Micrococcus luteus]|uniref:hypothetical protein n=1 Tax=Micrococcus luteus TaxID=1270 RepID=UPI00210329E0|nr:hypothetical protein [Micrococcus luteus]UTX35877.1 hypothetical protein NNL26_11720 [Micrococcus luteus]